MKSKTFIIVLFTLLAGAFAFPANAAHRGRRIDTIDQRLYNYAKNTPDDVALDIDKLVDYLKAPAANKRDMAKAFSYWITQNISYDIEAFFNGSFNQQGINGTLSTKKGVCQDYSDLFKSMCDRAGIECYVVAGYAKAFDFIPGSKFKKANHAWNVILLDNNYYLMDLTWASGYIANVGQQWRYYLRTDPSQFFADPEVFVEKHLPSDPKWQLLPHPVSMDAFLRFDIHQQMIDNSSAVFNYRDSISTFISLGKTEQELKAAEDAYNFYPVLSDYAYHYYNSAVTYSNTAIDFYNLAVNSYNKSISAKDDEKPTLDYDETGITNAINNYFKAIKLLARINHYSDNNIDTDELVARCNKGVAALKELMTTLK